ncbi:MAG: ABC transporter permease [Lachnospiraceae bacterium]|nr:ABC transporter permease [Lachnospiraceae bacterium]
MLFVENILLALSSLRSNKIRALLTMLGIIIGIGSVIAIVTVGNSLTNSVNSSMESVGANNVNIGLKQKEKENEITESGYEISGRSFEYQEPKSEDLYTDEMIESLKNKYPNEIKEISISEDVGNGKVTQGDDYANVSVSGVNEGFFVANNIEIIQGTILSGKAMEDGKSVALVSDYFVDNLYGGDASKAIGKKVEVISGMKYYVYTIVGVYKYQANTFSAESKKDTVTPLFIPIKTAKDTNHSVSGYSTFTIVVNAGVSSWEFSKKSANFLKKYYRNNNKFEPSGFSLESLVSTYTDMMSKISLAISVIAGISLVVGGIGVMNIMLVSISERTKEIGTRKALGATNGSIRVQFIVEAIVICIIGGIFGIIVGIGGGMLAAKALGFSATPSLSSIVVSLLFSMGIGVFFGYYPANKASKMNPIDALRYE